jgi:hypothetical protein
VCVVMEWRNQGVKRESSRRTTVTSKSSINQNNFHNTTIPDRERSSRHLSDWIRKSKGVYTDCRQKEKKCETGHTLQWEKGGNITQPHSPCRNRHDGIVLVAFGMSSHRLLRCLDKQHCHVSDRRRRVESIVDQTDV